VTTAVRRVRGEEFHQALDLVLTSKIAADLGEDVEANPARLRRAVGELERVLRLYGQAR
jgi:hypothetical protein